MTKECVYIKQNKENHIKSQMVHVQQWLVHRGTSVVSLTFITGVYYSDWNW